MYLFIYKDLEEKNIWDDYFSTLENAEFYLFKSNDDCFEYIKNLNSEIDVFAISSEIFSSNCFSLLENIKKIYPLSEWCVFLTDPNKTISFNCLIQKSINHVIIRPKESEDYVKNFYKERLAVTLKKIAKKEKLDIGDYVSSQTKIYSEEVSNSEQKELLIKKLEALINGENDDVEFFKQRVALLADEMLENALYGAPRTEQGNTLFKKGDTRNILNKEKIIFYYAYEDKTLIMEISDNWGSLVPNTVLELLEKNNNNDEIDFDTPGGRGFFIMSRFFDLFHIIINPGKETKVGGHLIMNPNFDPMNKKGFHIQVQKN